MGQGANTSATGWSVFATNPTEICTQKRCPDSATGCYVILPSIAAAGQREPDEGGLNVEGLAWEPDTRTLLFGLREPSGDRGIVSAHSGARRCGRCRLDDRCARGAVDPACSAAANKGQAGHPRHLVRRTDRQPIDSRRPLDKRDRRTVSALLVERRQRWRPAARCHLPQINEAGGRRRIRRRRRKETPHRRRPRWLCGCRLSEA